MEIDKLRKRLKNIERNVTEYRMTVSEAQGLVKEFEALEKQLKEKPRIVVVEAPAEITRTIDGGTF